MVPWPADSAAVAAVNDAAGTATVAATAAAPSPEYNELIWLLALGAGSIAGMAFLIIFISNRSFRVWVLVGLVGILGYLTYVAHRDHVLAFAGNVSDTLTSVSGPFIEDLKARSAKLGATVRNAPQTLTEKGVS